MNLPTRLTPEQAQEYIGTTAEGLKRLRLSRKVRFYRHGHRSVSYDRASIDQYMKSIAVEPITGLC